MLSEIWFSGGYFGVHASWSCHRWFGVDTSGPAGSAPPDPVIIDVFFKWYVLQFISRFIFG